MADGLWTEESESSHSDSLAFPFPFPPIIIEPSTSERSPIRSVISSAPYSSLSPEAAAVSLALLGCTLPSTAAGFARKAESPAVVFLSALEALPDAISAGVDDLAIVSEVKMRRWRGGGGGRGRG